jgi:D-glycero-D-manno-heptose 1,7-bisphosphate phosphatase
MIGHIICEVVERNLFVKRKLVVFLDRDGVINKKMPENNYVKNPEEFVFLPGSFQALKLLKEKDFLVVVVTNQRCIAKGIIDENQLNNIHKQMNEKIQLNAGRIDAIYICPHDISDHCICRKPNAGLFLKAIEDFDHRGIEIDIGRSFMIGDSEKDIVAGKAAGLQAILVGDDPLPGTLSAKNLLEAVQGIVLEQHALA